MSARDLLVELGTEELPPLALRELENAFAEGIRTRLNAAGVSFAALQSYASFSVRFWRKSWRPRT